MKFSKKEIFLIPNVLTYIRFILVPIFIWIALDKRVAAPNNMMVALGIFMFATFTDFIDGKIARKFNMVSDIGKVLDPFADKLLQMSALICLSITLNVHWAFTIILVLKESYMIIAATMLVRFVSKDVNIEANVFGKVAAFFNALGIFLSFFHNLEGAKKLFYIDWVILGIGLVFAFIAVSVYTVQIYKEIMRARESRKEEAQE